MKDPAANRLGVRRLLPHLESSGALEPCRLRLPKQLLGSDFLHVAIGAVYQPDDLLEGELERFMKDWHVVHAHRHEQYTGSPDWSTWFALAGRSGSGLENTTVLAIRGMNL